MKTVIDQQTLVGFLSATGLPVLFKTAIAFVHPALYTIYCGQVYRDGIANCYADDRAEAFLWLLLSGLAIAYGGITLWHKLGYNPAPPAGSHNAIISNEDLPVTVKRNGTEGPATAQVSSNIATVTPLPPPPPKGS